MQLGIFSKTFANDGMDTVFARIASYGFKNTHFPLTYAGLTPPYTQLNATQIQKILQMQKTHDVKIESLSGTYNMIHPDKAEREFGKQQLFATIDAAHALNVPYVTLCTGTFSTQSMWQAHAQNETQEAFTILCEELSQILVYAEDKKVTLLLETEQANVINNAQKCRKLLDTMQSPYLKVIMDAANLFTPATFSQMERVLKEAFDLLAQHIRIAHAKDIAKTSQLQFVAAGDGILDYRYYFSLLKEIGFAGALQLHGLDETQVERSIDFVKRTWESVE